jgi:hypothetical protein
VQVGSKTIEFDKQCEIIFIQLLKSGVLEEVGVDQYAFSSPLVKRFYFKYIFPSRSFDIPSSLFDLVRAAIKNMSASTLGKAIINETYFPKEAAFQHEFMAMLAAALPPHCLICPDFSRIFPGKGISESQNNKADIAFYISGDLRWGIELVVKGKLISERIARFSENSGKYFPLHVHDYVVVDFRRTIDGNPTNVIAMEKRITVFFQDGNYSRCICKFGLDEGSESLILKK